MVGWGSRRSEAILRTHIPGVKILESKMDEARLLLGLSLYHLCFTFCQNLHTTYQSVSSKRHNRRGGGVVIAQD